MLIQNAFRVKRTGEIFNSIHVHDLQATTLDDGLAVFTDGGLEYLHRSLGVHDPRIELLDLKDTDAPETIRARLLWGTRGPEGKDKFRWCLLNECETSHLENIIANAKPSELRKKVIMEILKERNADA